MSSSPPVTTILDRQALFATLAGICASLVGIGLARFAYTPLIPALIEQHWFPATSVVTLAAANFAGYLVGAVSGRPLATRLGNHHALRWLMVAASIAFIACAWPLSVGWFFVWRFISGVAGGAIMILVATTILPHIPAVRRGFVSGMIFLGLGAGIAASGTLVPELLHLGLQQTWLGLGGVSLLLTAISWFGWPTTSAPASSAGPSAVHRQHSALSLKLLYAQYAANALGIVPAMMLLVDFIARGLHQGAMTGARYWVLYGLAAIVGPVICGQTADHIGFRTAYRLALLLQLMAAALLAFSQSNLSLIVATVILGAFTPGIVPLVLGRIHELIPHDHGQQRAAWSRATTAFALFQAIGGYGYSFLFSHFQQNYQLIFAVGGAALLLALTADFIRLSDRAEPCAAAG
ncbi:YbfB/YjiJ family MFS transporter [Pokkaliibacter sp. MBI-7]|uniref:YbfB/YjiJ family MFS transporter n=1 Tax=Pokkaliibacter sp. MBI-7 TaxID=3040600 RepID=UPI0024494A5A|nr:YbfB/YjiJ family MFS transporter [Pokkaliibacter sp. MBI-7]MDH2434085.1 YbfB/YjiJ family MFS transporter [Pokkaliibacter sp. MBI-7]